uniref:RING-type E3 ubiquitin transferase n=1 Tax=Eptatretus burgeri TaxID=7764 RepID=A0A8C4QG68_EPTBU
MASQSKIHGPTKSQLHDRFQVRVQPQPRGRVQVHPGVGTVASGGKKGEEVKGGSPGEGVCVVCCQDMNVVAMGSCDHPVCLACSVKMRVLCGQPYCAVCRLHLDKVFITRTPTPFVSLDPRTGISENEYGFSFCDGDLYAKFKALLSHTCPLCPKLQPFGTLGQLQAHMRRVHDLHACDLCLKHLKIFTHERRWYSRQDLAQHRRSGDTQDRSHRGHPLCQFCSVRFLDNDELLRHLRQNHYYCHFCDADGSNEYYSDYESLKDHFRRAHFLCEEGECAHEQFTHAFRSEIDLRAHRATVHSRNRAEARHTRQLELAFSYPSRHVRCPDARSFEEDFPSLQANSNVTFHTRTCSWKPSNVPRTQGATQSAVQPKDCLTLTTILQPKAPTPAVARPGLTNSKTAPAASKTAQPSFAAEDFPALSRSSCHGAATPTTSAWCGGAAVKLSSAATISKASAKFSAAKVPIQPSLAIRPDGIAKNDAGLKASALGKELVEKERLRIPKNQGTMDPMESSSSCSTKNDASSNAAQEMWSRKPGKKKKKKGAGLAEVGNGLAKVDAPSKESEIVSVTEVKLKEDKTRDTKITKDEKKTKREQIHVENEDKKGQKHKNSDNGDDAPLEEEPSKWTETKGKKGKGKNKVKGVARGESESATSADGKVDGEENLESKTEKRGLTAPVLANGHVDGLANGLTALQLKRSSTCPPPPPPGLRKPDVPGISLEDFPVPLVRGPYLQPENFSERNQALIKAIRACLLDDKDRFNEFRRISGLFRQGTTSAEAYYQQCRDLLGNSSFPSIFPELLILLPDLGKQCELLSVHGVWMETHESCRTTKPVSKGSRRAKRSVRASDDVEKTEKPLPGCSICQRCGQVLGREDVTWHAERHMDTDFPQLGHA